MGLMDRNIFKILPENTPARMVSNIRDANFQRRFFNTVKGMGCRVVIPDKEGAGCMIVVDGTSDLPLPSGFPNAYDPTAHRFIAKMSNSPDDGRFYEVEWRESDSTWNSLAGGRTGIAFQAQGGDGLDDNVIFECIQSTSTTGNIVYTYFEQFDAPASNRQALQIGLDGARKIARWVDRLVQN